MLNDLMSNDAKRYTTHDGEVVGAVAGVDIRDARSADRRTEKSISMDDAGKRENRCAVDPPSCPIKMVMRWLHCRKMHAM